MAGQKGQAAERAQQNAQQQSAPKQQFATLQEFCALHELQLPPIECGGGGNCFYNCCAAAGAWHAWNEADAGTRDALQARVRVCCLTELRSSALLSHVPFYMTGHHVFHQHAARTPA